MRAGEGILGTSFAWRTSGQTGVNPDPWRHPTTSMAAFSRIRLLGNVVGDGVARDGIPSGIFIRWLTGTPVDDAAELDLPVGLAASSRDQRLLFDPTTVLVAVWKRMGSDGIGAGLTGIDLVVEADAENQSRPDDTGAETTLDGWEIGGSTSRIWSRPPSASICPRMLATIPDRSCAVPSSITIAGFSLPLSPILASLKPGARCRQSRVARRLRPDRRRR